MGETSSRQYRDAAAAVLDALLDLLLPPQCAGCGAPGSIWCPDCMRQVEPFRPMVCGRCQGPCLAHERLCRSCARARSIPPTRSFGWYQPPLSRALVRLKYKPQRGLAKLLSQLMQTSLAGSNWSPSLVVPVPLHAERSRQRGFNQAWLLARCLASGLGIPANQGALRRTRNTPSQVGLNQRDREHNMRLAFAANGDIVEGESVLIVDDLRTTGATIRACGRALAQAGATAIQAVTVAQAGALGRRPER